MNKLYNKILAEALDIMDFDSWDDNEQSFKKSIENSLNAFIYGFPKWKRDFVMPNFEKGIPLKIFSTQWLQNNEEMYRGYIDKDNLEYSIYIDGEKVVLDSQGSTIVNYLDFKKDYNVIITGLDNITDCTAMFGFTDIKIPVLFDTSKSTSMKSMFKHCELLIKCPKYDVKSCDLFDEMFSYCKNLVHVPMFKNFEPAKLVDRGPLWPAPDKYGNNMFYGCINLDEETIETWRVNPCKGEDYCSPDWFFPHIYQSHLSIKK